MRSSRKRRRSESHDEAETAFGNPPTPALRAFHLGLYSLIPVAGLFVGPVAIVRALAAWRQRHGAATAAEKGYIGAALVLGVSALLCNAAGLVLMVLGLTS
jgi:hypothetical protein